jgi:biotin carboxyl carrier protein
MAKYRVRLGEEEAEIEVEEDSEGFRVRLDGAWHPVSMEQLGDSAHYSLLLNNHPYEFFAEEDPHGYRIVLEARTFAVTTKFGREGARPSGRLEAPEEQTLAGENVLTSPMAGVVQAVHVSPGDEVEAGAVVLIIEAMKMQNELRARRAGTVKAVYVTVGQRVEQGTPLLVLL